MTTTDVADGDDDREAYVPLSAGPNQDLPEQVSLEQVRAALVVLGFTAGAVLDVQHVTIDADKLVVKRDRRKGTGALVTNSVSVMTETVEIAVVR